MYVEWCEDMLSSLPGKRGMFGGSSASGCMGGVHVGFRRGRGGGKAWVKVIGHRQLDTCRTVASCGLILHTVIPICIFIVMYTILCLLM